MKNEIQIYLTKEWLLKRIAVEHNITTGLLKIKKNIVQWNWCKNISFLKIIGECPVTAFNEIKNILSTIDHNPKAIQDIIDCYVINAFFICSFYHQTCVIDQTNNQVKPTPPCKEVIENMEINPKCNATFRFTSKMYQLNLLCPNLFAGERMNFGEYPRRDIKNLENCQMNHNGLCFHFYKLFSLPSILFLPKICLRSFLAQPAFGKECKDTFPNPASIYLFKVTVKTLLKDLTYVQSYQWQYQKDVLRYFVSSLLTWNHFRSSPNFPSVDFEQVNICWENYVTFYLFDMCFDVSTGGKQDLTRSNAGNSIIFLISHTQWDVTLASLQLLI